MSIALVVTSGYGNGTLEGSTSDIVTMGYTVGEDPGVEGPSLGVSSLIELTVGGSSEIELTVGKS